MRILEKYVTISYVGAFILCTILLIVLGVIGDVLGFLDDIVKNSIPISSILSFYLNLAPFAFVNMVPFAALLSSVYIFNNLSKNHEVTAVIASGISLWNLLKPILLVTGIFCLITFIVNDKIVPSSMEKANRIRNEELEQAIKSGKKIRVVKDAALYGEGGQIIYTKSFDPEEGVLSNVIILKQDKNRSITEKVSAREVKWENGKWKATDVIIFKTDKKGAFGRDPEMYQSKVLNIKEKPEDFLKTQSDPRFMSYSQLRDYIKIIKVGSPMTLRRLLVDLNFKLAFPFTALITVLIGVPFCIETGRASALIGMVRGILAGVIYIPVMAISLALGKGGTLPPVVAAWLTNVVFIIIGAYYVNKKS